MFGLGVLPLAWLPPPPVPPHKRVEHHFLLVVRHADGAAVAVFGEDEPARIRAPAGHQQPGLLLDLLLALERQRVLDVARAGEAHPAREAPARLLDAQHARLLQIEHVHADIDEAFDDAVHLAAGVHPHVPPRRVDGVEYPLVTRLEELVPQARTHERGALRAPVVGKAQAVYHAREPAGDVADDADVELDDAVGQRLDLLPLQVQVGQRVLEAPQAVHALEEQHEYTGEDVLPFAALESPLHAFVKGGVVRVRPAVGAQRAPVLKRVPLDLAHVRLLGTRPQAAPFVVGFPLIVVAGAGLVPAGPVRIADAHAAEFARQPVGAAEFDRALYGFITRHHPHHHPNIL